MSTEQERAELLPCPFCGSTYIEIQTSTPDREGTPTHLMCADCGAAGPWSYESGGSYTVAAAFWNARAALQSQDQVDAERYRCLSSMATQQADALGPIFRIDVRRTPQTLFNFDAAVDHAIHIEGEGK